jgi:hypothetical protein
MFHQEQNINFVKHETNRHMRSRCAAALIYLTFLFENILTMNRAAA